VNRRGFFGTLAALPALLRGKLPLPPVIESISVSVNGGLEAWLPAPGDNYFGIDRSVDPDRLMPEGRALTREALYEAANRMRLEAW
jgi:hypothetical protein